MASHYTQGSAQLSQSPEVEGHDTPSNPHVRPSGVPKSRPRSSKFPFVQANRRLSAGPESLKTSKPVLAFMGSPGCARASCAHIVRRRDVSVPPAVFRTRRGPAADVRLGPPASLRRRAGGCNRDCEHVRGVAGTQRHSEALRSRRSRHAAASACRFLLYLAGAEGSCRARTPPQEDAPDDVGAALEAWLKELGQP